MQRWKKTLSLIVLILIHTSVWAESIPLMIPHSGTVSVNGAPLNGPGQFKFAIINKGCITGVGACVFHWTNEKNSDPPEIEPATWITLTVTNGIFGVKLGDVSVANNNAANMPEIPVSAFSDPETYLRIWFTDGTTGFQQLTPDRQLISVPYAYRAEVANEVKGSNLVTSNTNVGIGTTSPSTNLHFVGDQAFFVGNATNGIATMDVNNTGNGPIALFRGNGNVGIGTTNPGAKLDFGAVTGEKIRLYGDGNAAYSLGVESGELRIAGGVGANDIITFRTQGYAGSERVRITGSGNVGIGTTEPSERLNVSGGKVIIAGPLANGLGPGDDVFRGTLRVIGSPDISNGRMVVLQAPWEAFHADRYFMVGYDRFTEKFSIRGDGTYFNASSRDLKKDITLIENALASIARVEGVYYRWIDSNSSSRKTGFIAEDLAEIIPEAVDDGKKQINYVSLIPILVQGIKELKAQAEEQQQVIEGLKKKTSEMDALKVRLSALEGFIRKTGENLKELQRSASGDGGEVVIGREEKALVAEADRRN